MREGQGSFRTISTRNPVIQTEKGGLLVDSSILPYITGGSSALVILCLLAWAFYTGKLHSDREFNKLEAENGELRSENNSLREALRTERRTSDDIADTAKVSNKLMDALVTLALERRAVKSGGIMPEDIGL